MKRKKDKKTNGRKSLQYRGTQCLNCGHPLDKSDVYCPNCSQLNSDKQLTLKDFIGEFINSLVVYDSRLRNTISDLLFRPGVITRNFMKGQRVKYANPFRFFLSISIIFFLFQGLIGTFGPKDNKLLNINTSGIPKDSINQIPEILFERTPDSLLVTSDSKLRSLSFPENVIKRFETYHRYYQRKGIKDPGKALDSLNHPNTFLNRFIEVSI